MHRDAVWVFQAAAPGSGFSCKVCSSKSFRDPDKWGLQQDTLLGLPGLPGLSLCIWALLNTSEGSLRVSTLPGGQ